MKPPVVYYTVTIQQSTVYLTDLAACYPGGVADRAGCGGGGGGGADPAQGGVMEGEQQAGQAGGRVQGYTPPHHRLPAQVHMYGGRAAGRRECPLPISIDSLPKFY